MFLLLRFFRLEQVLDEELTVEDAAAEDSVEEVLSADVVEATAAAPVVEEEATTEEVTTEEEDEVAAAAEEVAAAPLADAPDAEPDEELESPHDESSEPEPPQRTVAFSVVVPDRTG